MLVCAVEKRRVTSINKGPTQRGYIAGDARIAVLPNATADQLGSFIRSNIKPGTWIISDGFTGYARLSGA